MSERKKFRKNNFRQLISHPFWSLNRKNSEYTWKFRLLIKTKVYVSRRKFTEQSFWEKLLKSSRVSGWVMKFLGQWRNFFIRVAKTEKLCPEEQIKETTFSEEKSLLFFFKILWQFFSIPAETFAKVVEIVIYVALEDFEQKNIWNVAQYFNFGQGFKPLSTLRQNNWSFNPKNIFRFVTTAIRASRGSFCGKSFLFPENFCFLYQIWSSSDFFVAFQLKICRCVKVSIHV